MKKLVLLFAAVFAMTFVSCDTKPASNASTSSASTSAPANTENVQSTQDASNTDASQSTSVAKEGENSGDKSAESKS